MNSLWDNRMRHYCRMDVPLLDSYMSYGHDIHSSFNHRAQLYTFYGKMNGIAAHRKPDGNCEFMNEPNLGRASKLNRLFNVCADHFHLIEFIPANDEYQLLTEVRMRRQNAVLWCRLANELNHETVVNTVIQIII